MLSLWCSTNVLHFLKFFFSAFYLPLKEAAPDLPREAQVPCGGGGGPQASAPILLPTSPPWQAKYTRYFFGWWGP